MRSHPDGGIHVLAEVVLLRWEAGVRRRRVAGQHPRRRREGADRHAVPCGNDLRAEQSTSETSKTPKQMRYCCVLGNTRECVDGLLASHGSMP